MDNGGRKADIYNLDLNKKRMRKKFNVTGLCVPDQHYMADVSKKLAATMVMVEEGDYFIINRPRQYGKTTTLYTLAAALRQTDEYVVIQMSFEGVGDNMFKDEIEFSNRFVKSLTKYAARQASNLEKWLKKNTVKVNDMEALSDFLTEMVSQTEKKVVLMIDEVDKSSNNQHNFLFRLTYHFGQKIGKSFHIVDFNGVFL